MAIRTSTAALALLALGACLGAALLQQQPRTGGGAAPRDTPIGAHGGQQPEVDKRRVDKLTAVRAPADVGDQAFAHVRTLTGFGQRHPGTPGWTQQLAHIESTLQACGLTVRRDTWTDRRELITFTNLAATIPGKRKQRIVLACHHDTKCTTGHKDPAHNFHFVGANDGASAVGLLLALAPVLMQTEREATVELVFFDGEESLDWEWNDAARALFGSKRFVKAHREALLTGEEARIEALILLDMVGRTDLHIQDETYSTLALRQIVWSAAVACGHERHFYQRAEPASDDHKPFLDVGIPAVDLIDLVGNPHWHKPTDTIDNISPRSMQIVADVVLTMLPEVERRYVLQPK
jgi:glutaminyl-peptide cyclotransferase